MLGYVSICGSICGIWFVLINGAEFIAPKHPSAPINPNQTANDRKWNYLS